MNILILTTHLDPGGIPRYVINLSKGLQQHNHRVWIATSRGAWLNKVSDAGVFCKLIPIDTKSILSPKIILSLLSLIPLINSERFSVVHANTRVTQALGHLIQKIFHIPCVSSFHGFYNPKSDRRLLSFAGTKTIAVSRSVKEHLEKDFKIPTNDISVVPNGIDLNHFSPKGYSKEKLGFKPNETLIGILGRVSEEKGHFLALEAMSLLGPHHTNSRLLINGTGKMEGKFKELINNLGLINQVSWLNLEAEVFLDIVDILLVPSKKEGFGFSVIEAFAKGVPVVAFKTGGISEIITDGKDGLLFTDYDRLALKNKIEEVLSNYTLQKNIVQNAKNSVLSYTIQIMAEKTEKVYEQAIGTYQKKHR